MRQELTKFKRWRKYRNCPKLGPQSVAVPSPCLTGGDEHSESAAVHSQEPEMHQPVRLPSLDQTPTLIVPSQDPVMCLPGEDPTKSVAVPGQDPATLVEMSQQDEPGQSVAVTIQELGMSLAGDEPSKSVAVASQEPISLVEMI